MNPIKEAVHVPEPLVNYIEIGIGLYTKQQAGARFALDDLSEGAWTCLEAAIEGTNRARNQKAEKERQQAEMRARQHQRA